MVHGGRTAGANMARAFEISGGHGARAFITLNPLPPCAEMNHHERDGMYASSTIMFFIHSDMLF